MKLGKPEHFLDKTQVRVAAMRRAVAQFRFSSEKLIEPYRHNVDEHTAIYLKGFGNEINLLSAFRDLYFNSRELLDLLLGRIHKATAGSKNQAPKDFLPFVKRLLENEPDSHNLEIIKFLKTNITFIYHIRKIRNQVKNNPSSIEFNFNTDHFEARMLLPIDATEKAILPYLDIKNLDKALNKSSYTCILNLDIAFPEMLYFWTTVHQIQLRDGF